jgi:hypothetical protein
MMRNPLSLLAGWLCRADIHVAVDLLRISADNLRVKLRRKIQNGIAFAGRCGTKNNDELGLHGSRGAELRARVLKEWRGKL